MDKTELKEALLEVLLDDEFVKKLARAILDEQTYFEDAGNQPALYAQGHMDSLRFRSVGCDDIARMLADDPICPNNVIPARRKRPEADIDKKKDD